MIDNYGLIWLVHHLFRCVSQLFLDAREASRPLRVPKQIETAITVWSRLWLPGVGNRCTGASTTIPTGSVVDHCATGGRPLRDAAKLWMVPLCCTEGKHIDFGTTGTHTTQKIILLVLPTTGGCWAPWSREGDFSCWNMLFSKSSASVMLEFSSMILKLWSSKNRIAVIENDQGWTKDNGR